MKNFFAALTAIKLRGEKYSKLYSLQELIATPIALHELRFARLKNLSL